MATIKKAATRLGRLAQKGETKKVDRIVSRINRREARRDARDTPKTISGKSEPIKVNTSKPTSGLSTSTIARDEAGNKPKTTPPTSGLSAGAWARGNADMPKSGLSTGAVSRGEKAKVAETKTPAATAETFGQAFKRNRDAKAKTFEYKGKSYTTDTKEDVAKKAAPIKKAETSIPTPYSTHAQADKDTAAKKAAASTSTSGKRPAPEFKYPDYPSASGSAMTGGPESNDKNRPSQAPKKTAPAPPPNRRGLPPAKCGTKIKSKKK